MGKHSGRYVVRESLDVVIMPNGETVTVPPSEGFWRKRTVLEKILLATIILFIVVVSVAIAVTVVVAKRYPLEITVSDDSIVDQDEMQARRVQMVEQEEKMLQQGFHRAKTPKNLTRVLCDTPTCVKVAYRMITYMEASEDPCKNFYKYACGGWQKLNPVDANEMHKAINMNEMKDTVQKVLRGLLENEESTHEIEPFETARKFYRSCLMDDVIDHRGFKPARQLMQQLGGLNTKSTWPEHRVNLTALLKKLLTYGGSPFFDLSITLDAHNSSRFFKVVTLPSTDGLVSSHWHLSAEAGEDFRRWLKKNASRLLEQPTEGVVEDDYNEQEDQNTEIKIRNEYLKYLNSSNATIDRHAVYTYYKLIGDAKEVKDLSRIIRKYFEGDEVLIAEVGPEILEFAQKMKKIIPDEREYKMRDSTGQNQKPYTIRKLSRLMNTVNWPALMTVVFDGEILAHDLIYVEIPDYLVELNNLIRSYDERVVANAAIVLYARQFLLELVTPYSEEMPRPEFCVEATKTIFPEVMSAMYLRSQDKDRLALIQSDMTFIYSRLKSVFKESLVTRDFLNPETRRKLMDKAESLSASFVGDKIFWNDTFIRESIEGVEISEDKFFENVISVSRLGRVWLKKLSNMKVDRTLIKWVMASQPYVINAFNLQPINEIVVPLGILQPPYYETNAPKYIQFGGIGTTLGHEFIHGFDTRGKMFDKYGNQDSTTWSPETDNLYSQRFKCLVDTYTQNFTHNITFFNRTVKLEIDGNFTLNENLADNGGLHLSNEAYHKWMEESGEVEPLLPGIKLNHEQLFFVSTAQMYCSSMTPLAYVFLMELDEHTTDMERTNAMMMNSPVFAKTFQCPVGSPMNPASKCNVW